MNVFRIGRKKIKAPSGWFETKLEQYQRAVGQNDFLSLLSILTGLDVQTLSRIEANSFESNMLPYFLWATESPITPDEEKEAALVLVLGKGKKSKYVQIPTNLGTGTFGQKLMAQRLIVGAAKKKEDPAIDELIAIYAIPGYYEKKYDPALIPAMRRVLSEANTIEAIIAYRHIYREILRLIERDVKYLNRKGDADDVRAGIGKLKVFGDMQTIDGLAGGNVLEYDRVLELEYDLVFKKLWYDRSVADYRERLMKIKTEKHKTK